MAYDLDKAHEISDDGLFITDGFHLVGGASSPLVVYPTPAVAVLYVRDNGEVWKYPIGGPWTLVGGSSVKNFSYHKIIEDSSLEIPIEQHMITTHIELDGFLDLSGGLVFL